MKHAFDSFFETTREQKIRSQNITYLQERTYQRDWRKTVQRISSWNSIAGGSCLSRINFLPSEAWFTPFPLDVSRLSFTLYCLIRSDKLVRVPSIPAKVYLAELEINSKHGPTFRWNVSTSKFVDAITTRWKRIPTRWTWKSCSACIRSGKRVDSFQSDRWLAAVFLVALFWHSRPPTVSLIYCPASRSNRSTDKINHNCA